jgi:SMC interacting uncharacterized protein involved in chromosome segregation
MADVEPNLEIGLKQLEVQRDELKLAIQKQRLRLLEIEEEKKRIASNTEAQDKEINNMEIQIKKLQDQIDKKSKSS